MIVDKAIYDTAEIKENCHCGDCGWPVIDVCCNDNFLDGVKDEEPWDWWYYCSNKSCKNHEGEGLWQNPIKWIVRSGEQS